MKNLHTMRKASAGNALIELSQLKIAPYVLCALGVLVFVWSFVNPRLRDTDGFPEGGFALPLSICVALIILGLTTAGRYRRPAFWFALALAGQAAALQLIEAGSNLRYQHYKTINLLLTDTHPVILGLMTFQIVAVTVGLRAHLRTIQNWIGGRFKVWQLLGIGLVFFLSSATVSQKVSKYIIELVLATFVQAINLGNVVLAVWALPEETLVLWQHRLQIWLGRSEKEDVERPGGIDRFVLVAAGWVVALSSVLCLLSYQRYPHVPDELVYLQQARYLANGSLTTPAPPVPDAFELYLMKVDGDRWYPVAPIGWPAVLSLGVLLRVPWLVNPLIAGLNIILAYLLLQAIFPPYVARMSVLLLCVSPWYIFMGMSFMTHMSSLLFALCAALALETVRRTSKVRWGWVAGGSLGLMSLVRPLEGLIVAILLGFWSIGLGGKRLKISAITGLVLGTAITGSVVLFYNNHLTGDPMVFPLNAYIDEEFGPNANALGFGPDRGMGWAIDPFPGHGPVDALVNTSLNIFSINVELFGWSIGSLILVALLVSSGVLKRSDYLMIAVILAVYIPHFFYYFSGGPDFGARYWFLMLIPLVVMTVRGMETLQTKLGIGAANPSFVGAHVRIGVLSLCLMALVNYLPWRAIDKYHHFRGMRPDIRELASENNFGKSLVLIRGDAADYPSAWFCNPVNLRADGNVPIYAWDRDPSVRIRVMDAYPDRPVWIVNGPSVTGSAYEIVAGPIPPGSDLSGDK